VQYLAASLCYAGGQVPGQSLLHIPLHFRCQQGQQREHPDCPGGTSLDTSGVTLLALPCALHDTPFLTPHLPGLAKCDAPIIGSNHSTLVQPHGCSTSWCLCNAVMCRLRTLSLCLSSALMCAGPSVQWMPTGLLTAKKGCDCWQHWQHVTIV
jgi:hypothetical protein